MAAPRTTRWPSWRPPTAQANDTFGGSVAIDGDTIVVGACCDDDGGSNSGSAYVFEDGVGLVGLFFFRFFGARGGSPPP